MATILNFLLSSICGLGLIAITSPTSPFILPIDENGSFITYRYLASAVDLTFALLISFLLLCSLEHRWIAKNRSFPYAYHPSWNLGAKALGFQLVMFETYHLHYFSRIMHIINLPLEEAAWLFIVQGTFGTMGLAIVNILLAIQAFSYGDKSLGSCITILNTTFSLAAFIFFKASLDNDILLGASKITLVLLVVLRTASHVVEPLPPAYDDYNKTFDRGFRGRGLQLLSSETLYAVWLFNFGIVQEIGAGIPGRLFNIAVVKVIYRMGYRSQSILDVGVAKERAYLIAEGGWEANDISRELFAWAILN
jgi:hypothetical protein